MQSTIVHEIIYNNNADVMKPYTATMQMSRNHAGPVLWQPRRGICMATAVMDVTLQNSHIQNNLFWFGMGVQICCEQLHLASLQAEPTKVLSLTHMHLLHFCLLVWNRSASHAASHECADSIMMEGSTETLTARKIAAASLLGKDDVCHAPAEVLHQVGHIEEGQQLDSPLCNFQFFLELLIMRFQLRSWDTRKSACRQHVMPSLMMAFGMS